MAKSTGLGQRLYIGGYDLSGDIGSLGNISGPLTVLDVTGIDKSAYERIGGVHDGSLEFNAWFNDAAGQAHPVLSALPTADVGVQFVHSPALGGAFAGLVGKQIDYAGTRGADGSLAFTASVQSSAGAGIEWGELLTAGKRTDTTATNGSSLDYGVTIGATNFGLSAYLQVFSFTGTTCTIAVQDSADGATGWANITGASFAAVTTAPQAQRIQTGAAQTVKRYLRVSTTGTFSNIVFSVGVIKHLTATL